MARADFAKRECVKFGHTYGINEFGKPTKDGVVTEGMRISKGEGGRLMVCDYSAVIGYLHGDFGYVTEPNSVGAEGIGSKKVVLPDKEIDLITRTVYRNVKGMYCEGVHNFYKADGVTKSEAHKGYREAAPFEVLR